MIAAAILVSGVLQLAVQWPALVRLGFRLSYDWSASRLAFWQVVRAMAPITLGLAVTQLNTLADSLIAWGLSAAPGAGQTIPWLPGEIAYPLETGAAAAIYYGERFYQLPVGLLGIAMATVIYPRVSAHAARGDLPAVAGDLSLGLRLVTFLARAGRRGHHARGRAAGARAVRARGVYGRRLGPSQPHDRDLRQRAFGPTALSPFWCADTTRLATARRRPGWARRRSRSTWR